MIPMDAIKDIRKEERDRRRARLAEFIRVHLRDTQKAFIDLTGINQGELSALLKDKSFGGVKARSLESLAGITKGSLDLPPGSPFYPSDDTHISNIRDASNSEPKDDVIAGLSLGRRNTMGHSNAEPGPSIQGEVPLISWDQARTWDPLMNSFSDIDARRWLPCPASHSAATFCIENNTETMDDGTANGYREGEILFVDPEIRAAPDKDIVVIMPNGKMLFRRFKEDGEGPYLLSLNGKKIDRWEEGTIVRGVVIFSGIFR